MNHWIIRVTEPQVKNLIERKQSFEHAGLNRFEKRIAVGDLVFIYLGGDTGVVDWQPGLWGFGKVEKTPFNSDGRNFSIIVKPIKVLNDAIPIIEGKLHPLYSRTLYTDAPYVGANHFPTQAISEVTNEGVFALWLMLEEKDKDFSQYIPSEARAYEKNMKQHGDPGTAVRPVGVVHNVDHHNRGTKPLPKPFLLLAGISGTGKTKWVRDQEEPGAGNLEIIPVRPDWHEPSDLLGYVSRISGKSEFVPTAFLHFLVAAWRNAWAAESSLTPSASSLAAMTPFWLCLDEMNLAPVEQYFADYLSVLESRKWSGEAYSCDPLLSIGSDLGEAIRSSLGIEAEDPLWRAFLVAEHPGIPLPPNLIVVGTVNMDETTHGFSRKVLDRALTVEFDAVDFRLYGGSLVEGHAESTLPWGALSSVTEAKDLDLDPSRKSAVLGLLESWNGILAQTSFRIAYRSINEALLIAGSLPDEPIERLLDWIAMAKLLPRLEGDEDKLGLDRNGAEASYLLKICDDWKGRFGDAWEESRSKAKLDFMAERLRRSGYTSFWP